MAHQMESMAYAGQTPWHGLGNKVTDDMTPAQMLKAAGIDWTVSKRELFFDKTKKIADRYALVRDSDDQFLSLVGSTYKPVQNDVALDFFTKFCEAGHMKMETAGSLWNGRFVWGLARIGKDFKLGKGSKADEVRSYLLLCQPHVHGKAMVAQLTPTRVVCWNTLTYALGASLKGKGNAFRMPHSQKFNDAVRASAEAALGLGSAQMDEFREAAEFLSKKKLSAEKVEDFFCEVLQYDPTKAPLDDDGRKKREPLLLPKFRNALQFAPGQQLGTALGTAWGALNAVTYVIDHEIGRDRSTALKTAWLGNKASVKRKAFNLAVDYAKAA